MEESRTMSRDGTAKDFIWDFDKNTSDLLIVVKFHYWGNHEYPTHE